MLYSTRPVVLIKCFLAYLLSESLNPRRFIGAAAEDHNTCNQDILDRSFVTQCSPSICEPVIVVATESGNKTNLDETISEWPKSKDVVVHIVSSRQGDRFKINNYPALDTTELFYAESRINASIFVNTTQKFQRILGFGTTLTDSTCTNVDSLPEEIRSKLISDYFSVENGIGLNLIKVPIGSTKYSFSNYVLDQLDSGQVELSPYDTDHRIPMIKEAMMVAGRWKNRIKLLASSATAPAEFKEGNRMIDGSYLKQDRTRDYAKYLIGFIEAYKSYELNIWSLILSEFPETIDRDEGKNETLDYNSMAMKPNHVIRLLQDLNEIPKPISNLRYLVLGDDKVYIPSWCDVVLNRPDVAKDVAGIAYTNNNQDKVYPYDNLEYATRRFPVKYLLTSQGSINRPIKLGNWQYGENYATELVKNLEYGSIGWIEFNMALNMEGGPFISQKFKVDPKRSTYYRNPMFYAIGHLSRYVKPGSIRVKVDYYFSAHVFACQYIAFITPDNYLVLFIMNNNIDPLALNIGIDTRTRADIILDTKSFNTFIFKL